MNQRVDRLIALCKLWGAVKYFHPYLAYRQDIDWDAALVATIPKVNVAQNANDYAAAVRDMLAALGDPVTRVIPQKTADIPAPEHELQPTVTPTADGSLVITVHDYRVLADWYAASQKIAAIRAELPNIRGILFDFRTSLDAVTAPAHERGRLCLAFQMSDITAALTTQPLVTAGERSRMHIGLVPQRGPTFYSSSFRVSDGRWITPAPDAHDLPIVFLINEWSELPPEAHALQIAGKALIVSKGKASDACLMILTHRILLGEGITAEIRLGEIACSDGSGGFTPDVILPPAQLPDENDPALVAALELLKDFQPGKGKRPPLPVHTAPKPENDYAEMAYPALEYRLLAAFRIWAATHYFFPYKDLMGEDWDQVLAEFIPRMEQAEDAVRYHLAVAEMVTHIHDTHGFVYSPVIWEYFGSAYPPVRLQIIEDQPVIIRIFDEEVAKIAGMNVGDVVLRIDGEDAMQHIAARAKYRPASTPQSLMYQAAWMCLSGPEGSAITLTLRDRDQQVRGVKLPRNTPYEAIYEIKQRRGEVTRFLTDEIGYADLDRLEIAEVDAMFEKFKHTQAIVFDMRGFPNGTMWSIAPRLAAEPGGKMILAHIPCWLSPDDPADDPQQHSFHNSEEQTVPPTEKWRYSEKTVMLIDERAISQAEATGLFCEAANGTKFIGSHTAGANGDVTNITAPGGIFIVFTGVAVEYADGRQLQRIGLVPDVEVKPTIKGIRDGVDEVLEAAIQYLQHDGKKQD
jgi:C-terminal processing protease CtpA/Prc